MDKKINGWMGAATFALTALAFVFLVPGAHAKPDAVSAASLSVSADSITTTSARINWFNDRYNYGSRTLCYDSVTTLPTTGCVVKNVSTNDGFFLVTGLAPNTKYYFNIKAIDTRGGERPYSTSGNFTTLQEVVGIRAHIQGSGAKAGVAGRDYDLRGRQAGEGSRAAVGGKVHEPVSPERKTSASKAQ